MKDSQKYYSMLVRIMKYYETANKREYFEECFEMTVMNPLFKANDIIGFLTSDDEEIVKYLAEDYHSQEIGDRVKKYIENAQIKYEKIKHRDTL